MKADRLHKLADGSLAFECPGCGMAHRVLPTDYCNPADPCTARWTWNGSMERPTFHPSIRVQHTFGPERTPKCCHSFVTDGRIKFCDDCTHEFAGQTLELPEWSKA